MTTIKKQLQQLGFTDDVIARTTVDRKPIADVPGGLAPKSRLPEGMNKTEALYAAELDWQVRDHSIVAWWYEGVNLRLAKRTWYKPDFLVLLPNGRLRFVEVKGYLRDDAAVKFKMARELYWFADWLMVRRVRGKFVPVNI